MRVHFVGVCGISMSALCMLTQKNGHEVSGSDSNPSRRLHEGIRFLGGHKPENVIGADLVVYTAAIKQDNPELLAAKHLNIPCMERAEFLAHIEKGYAKSVAVSGTHGKTTVSAMVTLCLKPFNPSVHIGGDFDAIGGNLKVGGNEFFVSEACEYKRSFVFLRPYVGIINNIETDHLDYFRDIDDIEDAFAEFGGNTKEEGLLVVNGMDARCVRVALRSKRKFVTFGICEKECTYDYSARELRETGGRYTFSVYERNELLCNVSLQVVGRHNVENALAAVAAARFLSVEAEDIKAGLESFSGVARRFDRRLDYKGAPVILDYAHHPTELRAAINAARFVTRKKLILVFQPHTYTRTKTLYDDFVAALSLGDVIFVAPTFASREAPKEAVTERRLVEDLKNAKKTAYFFDNFQGIISALTAEIHEGDCVLILGAGNIDSLIEMLPIE